MKIFYLILFLCLSSCILYGQDKVYQIYVDPAYWNGNLRLTAFGKTSLYDYTTNPEASKTNYISWLPSSALINVTKSRLPYCSFSRIYNHTISINPATRKYEKSDIINPNCGGFYVQTKFSVTELDRTGNIVTGANNNKVCGNQPISIARPGYAAGNNALLPVQWQIATNPQFSNAVILPAYTQSIITNFSVQNIPSNFGQKHGVTFYFKSIKADSEFNEITINPVVFYPQPATPANFNYFSASCSSESGSVVLSNFKNADGTPYNFSNGALHINLIRTGDNFPLSDEISTNNYSFYGLGAGEWSVQLLNNSLLCPTDLGKFNINAPPPPINVSATSNPVCFSETGIIAVSASGGVGNYKYSLNGGAYTSSNIFSGYTAGTYTITVKDGNNCVSNPYNVTIAARPAVTIPVSGIIKINPNGYGLNNGEIKAYASGGGGNFTYSINGSAFQSANEFQNLPAGNYTIRAKDANLCQSEPVTILLTQPDPLLLIETGKILPSCKASGDGSVTVNTSGGTSPYSYYINDVAKGSANTFTNLSAGSYTIKVFDYYNHAKQLAITISDPEIVSATVTSANAACYNGNGSITISNPLGGANSGYKFSADNGLNYQGSPVFNVTAGSYLVRIKDSKDCISGSYPVTILQPATQLTSLLTSKDVLCYGSPTGSANITVNGGTPGYRYSKDNWLTFNTTGIFTGLLAGDYMFQVRDQQNCITMAYATIKQPAELILLVDGITNVYCFGETGSIEVSSIGGTGNITYSSNPYLTVNGGNFLNVPAGIYTITATDENGCSKSETLTVSTPALITANPVVQPVSCYRGSDGIIVLNVSGGEAPYRYTLQNQTPEQQATGSDKFFGLKAGRYSFAIEDKRGCIVYTEIEVKQPDVLKIKADLISNVSCFGGSDGSFTILAEGGNGNYRYKLNGVDKGSISSFIGLTKGFYTVIVTDGKGCSDEVQVNISEPARLRISLRITDVICKGGNTGIIQAEGSGGSAPYTYSINGAAPATSSAFYNLYAGNYTVVIQDVNACTDSASITINEPLVGISATYTVLSESCDGRKDGSLSITGTVGEGMTYALRNNGITSNFQVDPLFPDLAFGSYDLIIKNNLDCKLIYPVSIGINPPLNLKELSKENVICNGGTNGRLTVTASGGTGVYQYKLNDGAYKASPLFNDLSAGNYNITVKDNRGCTAILAVTITEPAQLSILEKSHQDVSCYGGANGQITVLPRGGTAPYQYSINDGAYQSLSTFTGLSTGSYTIAIADQFNCLPAQTVSIQIGAPAKALNAIATEVQPVSCFGLLDGTILIETDGGTAPYLYSIDDKEFIAGPQIKNLTAGSHQITVQDKNKCSYTFEVTIPSPDELSLDYIKTDIRCFGNAAGKVTLNASGGNGNYTYSKDDVNFQASNEFVGLLPGTYIFTVQDSKKCQTTVTVELINLFPLLEFTLDADPPARCDEKGSITIKNVSGGKAPYTYSINGTDYTSRLFYDDLFPGNYTLFVQDANGCIVSRSISPYGPVSITSDHKAVNVSCFGGNDGLITMINTSGGTGNYEYAINSFAFQDEGYFRNLKVGIYQVTIRDKPFTCQSVVTVEIKQPGLLTAFSLNTMQVSCKGAFDGSFTASANGGTAPFAWSLNDSDFQTNSGFTGLAEGSYTLYVKDSKGCSAAVEVQIGSPQVLELATISINDVLCNGAGNGWVQIKSSGGTAPYRYSANGTDYQGSPIFASLSPGDYSFTVLDKNGCSAAVKVLVTEPETLAFTIKIEDNTCFGAEQGRAVLSASGGAAPYQYAKDSGSNYTTDSVFTGLKANTYRFAVKDANGCIQLLEGTIEQPRQIKITAIIQKVLCSGSSTGSISVSAAGGSGGYTYAMNDGLYQSATTFTNLKAGDHLISAKDANGCVNTGLFSVTQNEEGTAKARFIKHISCSGANDGELYLDASGGQSPFQYAINGGAFQSADHFKELKAGTYQVMVKDANGCSTAVSAEIKNPEILSLALAQKRDSKCYDDQGGYIELTAAGGTGPYAYSINNSGFKAGNRFSNLKAGNYAVIVRDASGCLAKLSTVIAQPNVLTIALLYHQNLSCYQAKDGGIEVNASGGQGEFLYSLNGAKGQASGKFKSLPGGSYLVEVTDEAGCSSQIRVSLHEPAPLKVEKTVIKPLCFDACTGEIVLNVSGGTSPYSYNWLSHPALGNSNKAAGLCSGIYQVLVTDAKGCTLQERIEIKNPLPIRVDGIRDTILCKGQLVTFHAGNPGSGYSWTADNGFRSTGEAITIGQAGIYNLKVTNAEGCLFSKSFSVQVSTTLLKADFLMSAFAAVGDTVIVVDISKPAPAKTGWKLPDSATAVGSNASGTIQQITFAHAGVYTLMMTAALGECADAVEKTITILDKDKQKAVKNALGYHENLLIGLKVSPNPAAGAFRAVVQLSEKADVRVRLLDFASNRLVETRQGRQQEGYEFEFDHPELPPGIYILTLEVGKEVKTVKMIKV